MVGYCEIKQNDLYMGLIIIKMVSSFRLWVEGWGSDITGLFKKKHYSQATQMKTKIKK